VRRRSRVVVKIAAPMRALTQRFAFLLLLLAAFTLMLLSKAEIVIVERLRAGVIDIFAPALDAVSRPVASVAEAVSTVRELGRLREENRFLREQNVRLLEWQQSAHLLAAQNRALQSLLNYALDPDVTFVTGRVIADSGGMFVRSVLVHSGARHGIVKGQAVLDSEGLVGRIAAVGDRSSRVLLVTDLNSRIPVVTETSRERAILAGDNSGRPKLVFLPPNASVAAGERIITSGHGGVIPPGLLVGRVVAVGPSGGEVRVQPVADLDRLEYVRIANFAGIAGPIERAAPPSGGRAR